MQIESKWCSASELTTFKGGGSALIYFPRNCEEFCALLTSLERDGAHPFILGGGSDVILADGKVSTPVISTKRMRALTFEGNIARFEAGVTISELMREARARGLGGFEFLEGVPATLGGALKMNAGAFGRQTSEFVVSARIMSNDVEYPIIRDVVPDFGYRRGAEGYVLGGALKLAYMDAEESLSLRQSFLSRRKAKQPSLPSCGSVFKNVYLNASISQNPQLMRYLQQPEIGRSSLRDTFSDPLLSAPFIPIGRLLEECGLKGARQGGAMISDLHANFIVNLGGAAAGDFLALVALAERALYEKFALRPSREFVLLA